MCDCAFVCARLRNVFIFAGMIQYCRRVDRTLMLCGFVWCVGQAAQYVPIEGVDGNDCAVVLEGSKHFIYNSGKGSP